LKKLIREIEKIRGRHTELVSVYVPAGGNIYDTINQLANEKGTASNIKSKATRKNVLTALDKIISQLRMFKQTPPNGLVVFSGNVSQVEGKEDIRIWSFEPPLKMQQKLYWCDQQFVLDPLRNIVEEKEIYGLIVLDAKEANIGFLKGKQIEQAKKLDSTVPGKTVKGGMCVSEDTLMQLEDGNIIPIKELSRGKKILSYSFRNFKPVFNDSFEIFKRKSDKAYELILKEPSNSLVLTSEHTVFVVGKEGIEEKNVDEINVGDMLLSISKLQVKEQDDKNINETLSQFLGYMLGDGTIDGNRIILYDKDIQLLKVYKKFAKKIIEKEPVILKRRNSYELRLYKKTFVDFIQSSFPEISKIRSNKDIDKKILTLPKRKLKYFIRGLFDAEGYVDKKSGIGLRMTNENVVKKLQLILTRFNIVASVRGPDKFNRYELRITNSLYVKNFKTEIGFSSLAKAKKLDSIIRNYKSGLTTRVPISGILVRKLIEKEGLKKEDFKKYGMFLVGRRNIGYPPFERMIREFERKFKNKQTLSLLNKIYNSGLVTVTVKEKREIKTNKEFYDLHVPGSNSFVANGIVVHNSQGRYDRIREDALNDFFTKVADSANEIFLKEKNLKGIIIGGPGPQKENFFKEKYLNYMLQNKVIGVKDVGYTGEEGLEELVQRSMDLLEQAAVTKERELTAKLFTELKMGGNVVYGLDEVRKAIEVGAVGQLLVSEEFNYVHVKLKCQNNHGDEKDLPRHLIEKQKCVECGQQMNVVEEKEIVDDLVEQAVKAGATVEYVSINTPEGRQFREIGGIAAFLRYKLS